MKNISMKVAVDFALACEPGARWHGGEIPAGYARFGVDEVLPGYETLELDIPAAEGEITPARVHLDLCRRVSRLRPLDPRGKSGRPPLRRLVLLRRNVRRRKPSSLLP